MHNSVLPILAALLLPALAAEEGKPNLSGTWKLDQPQTVLAIEQTDGNIHIRETRGNDARDNVSDFVCGVLGKECPMQDGGDKARVSAYYNGPVLVVMKTHGRKGSSVEKWRLSLSSAGDSLTMEVIRIDPEGKPEKLVFSKAR